MVSKQKMGASLSLLPRCTVRAFAASFTGLSASVQANSCSQTCQHNSNLMCCCVMCAHSTEQLVSEVCSGAVHSGVVGED